MKRIDAGEYALRKVFSSDFEFTIPDYQRPYSWGAEQALQLLDDLEGALERDVEDPYFLGSIVLVKEPSSPSSQVIDGQQRLTTLSLLFAVLRDLTTNDQLRQELSEFVVEQGRIMAGTEARPRLTLRPRDADFFLQHVQTEGQVLALEELSESTWSRTLRSHCASMRWRTQRDSGIGLEISWSASRPCWRANLPGRGGHT